MASHQIKGISSQYEEYRNQMKKSKKSEEYRNKRHQQMAQAQKLLNSNLPSEEIINGGGNNPLNNNRTVESWQKQQNLLQPFRGRKGEFRNMEEKGKGQISYDEALKTRESNQTIKSDESNQLTEDTSPVSFEDTTILNTSDCPKLRELKNRMLTRKKNRRLLIREKQGNNGNYSHTETTTMNREKKQMPFVESPSFSREESVQGTDNDMLAKEDSHPEQDVMTANDRVIKPRKIEDEDESVVDIDLIYCHHCERSYAPETYAKFCQKVDENGKPKCLSMGKKKRKVFNSAKMRIKNNDQLTSEEQQVAIVGRKRAVTDLRQKLKGNTTMKRSQKWREESASFRQAMETNRLVAKAEKEGKPSHYYL